MTTVYLVRHGESEANVRRIFSNGRVDLPLTIEDSPLLSMLERGDVGPRAAAAATTGGKA